MVPMGLRGPYCIAAACIPRSFEQMSGRYLVLLILALVTLIGTSGCLSTTIGEISYERGSLQLHVENAAEPVEDAVLQVTIMEVDMLEQREVYSEARYIDLDAGENTYTLHVDLQPGSYKLFLTIFVGDERRTSVIRDLEVTH